MFILYYQGEPGESGPPGVGGEPGKLVRMFLFIMYSFFETVKTCSHRN